MNILSFLRYHKQLWMSCLLVGWLIIQGCTGPPNIVQPVDNHPVAEPVDPPPCKPVPPPPPQISLRLCGSRSLGSEFIPDLVETFFFEEQKAARITRISDPAQGILTVELTPRKEESGPQVFEIRIQDSESVFKRLAEGECDIAFASRKITEEEIKELSSLGSMASRNSEYMIALSGIAIIVHRNNPLEQLTLAQIADIFSGKIQDWSEVGKKPGRIIVYAPGNDSGTYEAFQQTVLLSREQHKSLTNNSIRTVSDIDVANNVAVDEMGIGFVNFANIQKSKVLAVTGGESPPLKPDPFLIGREDYLLSYRLYLYLPENNPNPFAQDFVKFAISDKGQAIAPSNGLVESRITISPFDAANKNITYIQELISGPVRPGDIGKLDINIRFQSGGQKISNKTLRDIERIATFLKQNNQYSQHLLVLIGFTDSEGGKNFNLALSKKRAQSVGEIFFDKGASPIRVTGFGEDFPIAKNNNEKNRTKNRRVEAWLVAPNLLRTDAALKLTPPIPAPPMPTPTPRAVKISSPGQGPDWDSGTNKTAAGATTLDATGEEQGTIDSGKGDQTDWYVIKIPEKGTFELRVIQNSPATPLIVRLYHKVQNAHELDENIWQEELLLTGRETDAYTVEKAEPGSYYAKIFVQNFGEASKHTIFTKFIPEEIKPPAPSIASIPVTEPNIVLTSHDVSSDGQEIITTEEYVHITGYVEAGDEIARLVINGVTVSLHESNVLAEEPGRSVNKSFSYQITSLQIGQSTPVMIFAWDKTGKKGQKAFQILRKPGDLPTDPTPDPETPSHQSDTAPPIITIISPILDSSIAEDSVKVRFRVEDESRIVSVVINNEPLAGDTRGFEPEPMQGQEFTYTVSLLPGNNTITITAEDEFGNPEEKSFQIYRKE